MIILNMNFHHPIKQQQYKEQETSNISPEYSRIVTRLTGAMGIPFSPIILTYEVALGILKTITFYHFWKEQENEYDLRERCFYLVDDLAKIILFPLNLIKAELFCLYMIGRPSHAKIILDSASQQDKKWENNPNISLEWLCLRLLG